MSVKNTCLGNKPEKCQYLLGSLLALGIRRLKGGKKSKVLILANIQDRWWVATDIVEDKKNLETKIILEGKKTKQNIELLLKINDDLLSKNSICYPIFLLTA